MLLENQPDVPLAIQTALLLLVYMAWMLSVSCPLISYCSRTSHCLSLLTRLKADGDYGHVPSSSHTVFGVQRLNRCTSFPSWSQTGHHWEDVLFLLECTAQGSLHTISLHGWVVICFCRYCSLFCYPSSSILVLLLHFVSLLVLSSPPKLSERWWWATVFLFHYKQEWLHL